MFPDDPNAEPLSSFQRPFALPTSDPGDGPLVSVCFNEQWLPYVIGALMQLLQQTTWDTPPGPALDLVQMRAFSLIELFNGGCVPTGSIQLWPSATIPQGWLLCDGATYLKSDYPDLYGMLDAVFIVDATHFTVPDLRSRSPIGVGTGSGLSTYAMGDQTGEETHVLTVAELASHSHTDSGHTHSESAATATAITVGPGAPAPSAIPAISSTGVGNAVLSNTGSDNAHNTIHPVIALNFIIKT